MHRRAPRITEHDLAVFIPGVRKPLANALSTHCGLRGNEADDGKVEFGTDNPFMPVRLFLDSQPVAERLQAWVGI